MILAENNTHSENIEALGAEILYYSPLAIFRTTRILDSEFDTQLLCGFLFFCYRELLLDFLGNLSLNSRIP
jgi:hypothetical protein